MISIILMKEYRRRANNHLLQYWCRSLVTMLKGALSMTLSSQTMNLPMQRCGCCDCMVLETASH